MLRLPHGDVTSIIIHAIHLIGQAFNVLGPGIVGGVVQSAQSVLFHAVFKAGPPLTMHNNHAHHNEDEDESPDDASNYSADRCRGVVVVVGGTGTNCWKKIVNCLIAETDG